MSRPVVLNGRQLVATSGERFGGYFGIAGTYSGRIRQVRLYGASAGGAETMIRWDDQSGGGRHGELALPRRPLIVVPRALRPFTRRTSR